MDATAGSVAWTLVGGVVTLAVFSFLYKDNPLYKLAEHVAVGVSVGFMVVNYYYTVFMPKVWDNVVHKGQFDYLIPFIFGLLLYSRFVPKWGWVSRFSLAFLLGAGSGMSIPASLESRVLKQIEGTMASLVQKTQSQLILAEKMGALGHLIAGIAHEINSPLGAINSAREVLRNDMHKIIKNNRQLAQWLIEPDGILLEEMLNDAIRSKQNTPLSTREKRALRTKTIEKLEALELSNPEDTGRILTEINLTDKTDKYLTILKDKNAMDKLLSIANITSVFLLCETIEIAVDKASRTIFALKNYIRGSNDIPNMMITKTMVDIRKSVDTILTLYHNAIKNRATLTVEYENDLPDVIGNPDEINQIWSNIIQNAIQAISGNAGKIHISVSQYQNGVVVTIKDNGCGMSQEICNRVFEPMFTTKPVGEGTGLGMSIVHKIVYENHHGKIEIHSKENIGTSVSVWLPTTETSTPPEELPTGESSLH